MSFKILKNNCCGLDVHKTWIFACIGITDPNNRTEYKQARFSSFTKGLQELCDWLAKYNYGCLYGIYRMILTAIWHILHDLKPYTPEGFLESRPVNESKILTTSQALNLLRLRGYTIKDDVVPVN